MKKAVMQEQGVIYARYSAGSHQTEQSIEGQVRECTSYAKAHGIELIGEYIDRRISGTTDNREQFLQMIADSKRHKFDVVVTYKTDRFSRNRYDAAVYKRELQKNGVRVAYAKESIPDGSEGIILESLLEGLAEYYSAELRQKIERGMIESAHKRKVLGTIAFGYKKSSDGKYEIDKEKAPIVQMIFEKYCAGEKLKDIAQLAYSMGLRTRSGDVVKETRISQIVANPKYIGVYQAYGVRIEDGIPPIIDKETFYLAQKRLEYYKHHIGKCGGQGTANISYPLSGKAYCGHCGEPMVGHSAYGRSAMYHYYACRGKIHHTCAKKMIEKTQLEKLVVQITRQQMLDPMVMEAIIDGYTQLQENKDAYAEKRRQVKKAIDQTEKAIKNIVSAITDGFASESLKQKLVELERQKTQLNIEHTNLVEQPKMTQRQLRFLFLQGRRGEDESEEEYRNRLIDIFVDSVYLFDDKIVVTYNLRGNNSHPIFAEKKFTELEPILAQYSEIIRGSMALKFGPSKRRKRCGAGSFKNDN